MVAHIIYKEMDGMPAGFSRYWIETELRSRLGFGGAVFCDDLTMKATESYGSMRARARLALDAGCDMILVCNDRRAAEQAVMSLNEYSNALSLVRLVRLHGTGHAGFAPRGTGHVRRVLGKRLVHPAQPDARLMDDSQVESGHDSIELRPYQCRYRSS